MEGTARAYTEENRTMIKTRMKEIIKGLETSTGAKIELDYIDGYPPTINHQKAFQILRQSAEKITGIDTTVEHKSMGGEDFSFYLQKIPGSFLFVGASPEGVEPGEIPHHSSYYNFNEKALLTGASILIQLIEDRLIYKKR